jgi:hypothetical protein
MVLYLGVASIVLADPNPLWALPLVAVLIGLMWEKKWLALTGIALFSLVTVGRVPGTYLTDGLDLAILSVSLILPIIVLIDIVLVPRPYRIGKVSLVPILSAAGILAGLITGLIFMVQFKRIGVYLESDPTLQVFLMMSFALFLTAPFLMGSRTPVPSRKGELRPKT